MTARQRLDIYAARDGVLVTLEGTPRGTNPEQRTQWRVGIRVRTETMVVRVESEARASIDGACASAVRMLARAGIVV